MVQQFFSSPNQNPTIVQVTNIHQKWSNTMVPHVEGWTQIEGV